MSPSVVTLPLRKAKLRVMAPKSTASIPVGNCEVSVEAMDREEKSREGFHSTDLECVVVFFDGQWSQYAQEWTYTTVNTELVLLPKDVTHAQLLDTLYASLPVERAVHDLKLEAAYVVRGRVQHPTLISTDRQVAAFMNYITQIAICDRIALCVSFAQKMPVAICSGHSSTNVPAEPNVDPMAVDYAADVPDVNEQIGDHTVDVAAKTADTKLANCGRLGQGMKIMLTGFADNTILVKVVTNLGGIVTCDGRSSTHVIADKVLETLDFCTALCSGAWIVSENWLHDSLQQGIFLNEKPYILIDKEYELKYKLKLKTAISRAKACSGAFLKGYDVYFDRPDTHEAQRLSIIVRSVGAKIIKLVRELPYNTIYVADEKDLERKVNDGCLMEWIGTYKCNGDELLRCVMRQRLDLKQYETEHMIEKRLYMEQHPELYDW